MDFIKIKKMKEENKGVEIIDIMEMLGYKVDHIKEDVGLLFKLKLSMIQNDEEKFKSVYNGSLVLVEEFNKLYKKDYLGDMKRFVDKLNSMLDEVEKLVLIQAGTGLGKSHLMIDVFKRNEESMVMIAPTLSTVKGVYNSAVKRLGKENVYMTTPKENLYAILRRNVNKKIFVVGTHAQFINASEKTFSNYYFNTVLVVDEIHSIVTDTTFRADVNRKILRELRVKKFKSIIGLTGTLSPVEKLIKTKQIFPDIILKVNDLEPKLLIDHKQYIYEKGVKEVTNHKMSIVKKCFLGEGKTIIYYQDSKITQEAIADVFGGRDQGVYFVNADTKEEDHHIEIIENEFIPEKIKMLLVNSTFREGFNILNKDINSVHFLDSRTDSVSKKQFVSRFRNMSSLNTFEYNSHTIYSGDGINLDRVLNDLDDVLFEYNSVKNTVSIAGNSSPDLCAFYSKEAGIWVRDEINIALKKWEEEEKENSFDISLSFNKNEINSRETLQIKKVEGCDSVNLKDIKENIKDTAEARQEKIKLLIKDFILKKNSDLKFENIFRYSERILAVSDLTLRERNDVKVICNESLPFLSDIGLEMTSCNKKDVDYIFLLAFDKDQRKTERCELLRHSISTSQIKEDIALYKTNKIKENSIFRRKKFLNNEDWNKLVKVFSMVFDLKVKTLDGFKYMEIGMRKEIHMPVDIDPYIKMLVSLSLASTGRIHDDVEEHKIEKMIDPDYCFSDVIAKRIRVEF